MQDEPPDLRVRIGRPFRQQIAYSRNQSPFSNLMRWQITPRSHVRLGNFALRLPITMHQHAAPAQKPARDDDDDSPIV